MKKKLSSSKGESLVETLVALAVIVLCVSMLATAITTAAKVNKSIKDKSAETVSYSEVSSSTQQSVKISADNETKKERQVQVKEQNGYYYYEPVEESVEE